MTRGYVVQLWRRGLQPLGEGLGKRLGFAKGVANPFSISHSCGTWGSKVMERSCSRAGGRDGLSEPSALWMGFTLCIRAFRRWVWIGREGGRVPLSRRIVPHPFPDGSESHPCQASPFGKRSLPGGWRVTPAGRGARRSWSARARGLWRCVWPAGRKVPGRGRASRPSSG